MTRIQSVVRSGIGKGKNEMRGFFVTLRMTTRTDKGLQLFPPLRYRMTKIVEVRNDGLRRVGFVGVLRLRSAWTPNFAQDDNFY